MKTSEATIKSTIHWSVCVFRCRSSAVFFHYLSCSCGKWGWYLLWVQPRKTQICGAISSWSTYRLNPFARHLLWPFRMPLNQCYNFAPYATQKVPKNHQCHVCHGFFPGLKQQNQWRISPHVGPPVMDRPGVGRSEPQHTESKGKVVGRPNPLWGH